VEREEKAEIISNPTASSRFFANGSSGLESHSRSHFRPTRDTGKPPSIEFSGKASKLGGLEVLGEHITGELFLLVNDKRPSMW
jgi:hypothetical protein